MSPPKIPPENKSVKCEICGRICKSSRDHSQHKRCHVKKYACMHVTCLRKPAQVAFGTKRDLTRHHEQVHSKQSTQCPYCFKNLKRQDNLGRHITKLHGQELLDSAEDEDEATIRLVLDKGIYIETRTGNYGHTLLTLASKDGREAVARLLLGKGANIESRNNTDKRTPLGWAAMNGHTAIVELLLSNGANIEAKNSWNQTPLCMAAREGHTAVVKLLLEKGANTESICSYGTPLCMAAQKGHTVVVALLLEKGANTESTWSGETPLCMATREGHTAVVKLLLEKGANIEAKAAFNIAQVSF
ncbi:ankyrin repeat protein [Xylaria sp. FL0043]|nr:ankyrin repeat protein [Xylaria sp. FL0043]